MAGDWIKMRTDLGDDPAVVLIASRAKLDQDSVVGKLHRLWSWADRHTKDGGAMGITADWIDRFVGRKGFAQAMIDAGWLTLTESGVEFPAFGKHNGETAKKRSESSQRRKMSREMEDKSATNVPENQDKSATREEKKREEERREDSPTQSSNAGAALNVIHQDEFKSLERGLARYEEWAALGKVLSTPTERRRVLVLWLWAGRAKRPKGPCAAFFACLKAKEWNGSEAIEAEVEAFLRSKFPMRSTGTPDAIASLSAAKGVDDLPEDHP